MRLIKRRKEVRRNDYRIDLNKKPNSGYRFATLLHTGFDDQHDISFRAPSVTALLLDESYKAWKESNRYLNKGSFTKYMNFREDRPQKYFLRPKSENFIFNLLQKRMTSVVFAYTALESFANDSIPGDFVFRKENTSRKYTEEYSKHQAEYLSLDTKLKEVLPIIFNIASPSGTPVWGKYLNIKNLRDRIIHIKEKDKSAEKFAKDTIWSDLLSSNYLNFAFEAKDIIGYFLSSFSPKPRWFTKFPD